MLLLFAGWLAGSLPGGEIPWVPQPLAGDTFIHDPSTIIREGTNYYVFGTRPGVGTKFSPDLVHWTDGDPVFDGGPAWVKRYVPDFKGGLWAPDVIRVNGRFFLYYAASAFGRQTSAIGLATSSTLNPEVYDWRDRGPVIVSTNGMPFNAIDPSVMLDGEGKLWLAFGSFWGGIYLTELNPQTGLRVAPDAPVYHLAWNPSIEAAGLTRHGDYYYLFVNWGQCCQGTNSSYEVRVGRSEQVTGPYRDREGSDLATGGGTPFLQSRGTVIGPGHMGIVSDGRTNGPTRFSYHYYDATARGRSRLGIGEIEWITGWPVAHLKAEGGQNAE